MKSQLSEVGIEIEVRAAPDFPTWGRLLFDGKDFIDLTPLRVVWPGVLISLVVLSVNFMGDGLRDAADPYASI